MTKLTVAVLITLLTTVAQAQTPSRDDLVNRIEDAIGKPAPVTAMSPLVTSTLTMAKNANPDVDSHTWDEVRADTAVALTMTSAGPGSAFDIRVRSALKSFTDAEVQSLSSKLSDPLLLKFRDAIQDQANSSKYSVLSSALQMTAEINGILAKHNLKQISFGPEPAK
jgi:hypothetical protein